MCVAGLAGAACSSACRAEPARLVGDAVSDHTGEYRRIQEAFAKRDYDAAYQIVRAEGFDEADAAFMVGFYLAGGFEYIDVHTIRAPGEPYRRVYDPDLMERIPRAERLRVAWMWIRRAAYLGSTDGLREMADLYGFDWDQYPDHWERPPKDPELSACFKEASKDKSKLSACREMEQERGYAPP